MARWLFQTSAETGPRINTVKQRETIVEQSSFLELDPVVDRLMAKTAAPRSPEDLAGTQAHGSGGALRGVYDP